jgi:hypothetical protein
MKTLCLHCRKEEEEHCHFVPVNFPDNCQCDPGEWLAFGDSTKKIKKICGKFDGEIKSPCKKCEHDEACHDNKNSTAKG